MRNNSIIIAVYIVIVSYFGSSCKKYIEIDPPTNRSTESNVYGNDLTATAVLTGVYSNLSNRGRPSTSPHFMTFSKLGGIVSDEFTLWSGANDREKAYYTNDLRSIAGGLNAGVSAGMEFWNYCYGYIYPCNQAMDGISHSSSITPRVKQQLLGEAKFLRAFFFHYLVNLYGDVPLVTNTDPEINRLLPRAPEVEVNEQIIMDLKDAQMQLSDVFLNSSLMPATNAERVRPTKWAATAMLARVYLYNKKYSEAEAEATAIINQTSLFDVASTPLNNVFLKNSKEAIWQLQPVIEGWNTMNARWFNLSLSPAGFSLDKSVSLSSDLYNSFEAGDDRKVNWVGLYNSTSPAGTFYYPSKYKAGSNPSITATSIGGMTEYHMVLRMAEQYLIRAEARFKQGNKAGAVADLNILRKRARAIPTVSVPNPLPDLSVSLTDDQMLDAIIQERRVELFSEWGHRWLDLKRTDKLDKVMSVVTVSKGGAWQPTDKLWPLPVEDISTNPNLRQNTGY